MYMVGPVRYENFGPFEDVTVDFSRRGLTVIEGQIQGKRGCDSNGSGKSFLFEGVAWGLFGRCIRDKYDGDSVIRWGSKGGTCVTIHLPGEHPIEVRRYRKHKMFKDTVELFVDGERVTRGTSVQTTLAIEQYINMDFVTFVNSLAFGARDDVKSFFSAPDSERKKIMEKILGLELYSEAEKVARRKSREVAESLNIVTYERGSIQATLAEKESNLSRMRGSAPKADLENEQKQHQQSVRKLEKSLAEHDTRVTLLSEALEEEIEKSQVASREYERKRDEYSKKYNDATQAKNDADRSIAVIDSQQKQIEARIEKIKAQAGKTCISCSQSITKATTDAILKSCNDEMSKHRSERVKFELSSDQNGTILKGLVAPTQPTFPAVDAKRSELSAAKVKRAEVSGKLNTDRATLARISDEISRMENQEAELLVSIEETKKSLTTLDKKYNDLRGKLDMLQFWVDGFGNAGIKSFLIEAEIPSINQVATGYARRLLGDGAYVRLSPTKELKTKATVKEEMTVEGVIPGCTTSYAGASKGQRKRLDLCLILSFRDIVARRSNKSFNQMFADELFDGLDRSGCDSVVELLRDTAKGCPLSLITHDPRIKPAGDWFVTVAHNGSQTNPLAKILARNTVQATISAGKPLKKSKVLSQVAEV